MVAAVNTMHVPTIGSKRPLDYNNILVIAGSVGPYGAYQHHESEYTGNYMDHMTRQVSHVTRRSVT